MINEETGDSYDILDCETLAGNENTGWITQSGDATEALLTPALLSFRAVIWFIPD